MRKRDLKKLLVNYFTPQARLLMRRVDDKEWYGNLKEDEDIPFAGITAQSKPRKSFFTFKSSPPAANSIILESAEAPLFHTYLQSNETPKAKIERLKKERKKAEIAAKEAREQEEERRYWEKFDRTASFFGGSSLPSSPAVGQRSSAESIPTPPTNWKKSCGFKASIGGMLLGSASLGVGLAIFLGMLSATGPIGLILMAAGATVFVASVIALSCLRYSYLNQSRFFQNRVQMGASSVPASSLGRSVALGAV